VENLNHLNYYRLPWNLTDNSISWLEPTAKCNLSCYGCYRKNEVDSHKTLEEIKSELAVFKKMRKSDGISIAGGDPLLHPDIIEIVKLVKADGQKPIINTNGIALTKELLTRLKKAGVYGFTFHIDSKQNRPGWKNKNELELNELRLYYAKMLKAAGNISCAFNSTVYEDTIHYIPQMLKWAEDNIDIVQVIVFILYRAVNNSEVDYYLGSQKIDMNELVYNEESEARVDMKAPEVVSVIRKLYPDLNGSEQPDDFKWLLTGRLGRQGKIFGYMGSKAMEIIQTFHHILFDKYLAYSAPKLTRKGRSMLILGLFDGKLRKTLWKYLKNPFNIFKKLHYQSVMIIQPVDITTEGIQSMCDGCPDMTVWNGKLVWSCRMEEQLKYGHNLRTYHKNIPMVN
jgi:MoaA/NifB/PqqE/SkfB family radical SAM enzyme